MRQAREACSEFNARSRLILAMLIHVDLFDRYHAGRIKNIDCRILVNRNLNEKARKTYILLQKKKKRKSKLTRYSPEAERLFNEHEQINRFSRGVAQSLYTHTHTHTRVHVQTHP